MDLLIDGQALQTPGSRHRGIGRYSRNLVQALAAARPDWAMAVVQNERLEPLAADEVAGLPLLTFRPPLAATPFDLRQAEVNGRYYADWLRAWGPKRFLVLSPFESAATPPLFATPRLPTAMVLYDLIPLIFHQEYLTYAPCRRWYAHSFRTLLTADALLAISAASAADLRRLAPDWGRPVVNIAGAPDPMFRPLTAAECAAVEPGLRDRLGLRREFLLYVGGFDFRKNLGGALKAYAALPAQTRQHLDLVITCKLLDSERRELEDRAAALGIAGQVILTGFVSDAELKVLYHLCRLFLFPSLYEGLGLPVVEAMRCGAPVVAANTSSVPEYAGPVSWQADPADPEAMAAAILEALAEPRDARLAERLAFAGGFTWERIGAAAAAVLDGLPSSGAAAVTAAPRRPRVAWVAPMPPAASGIADYAADLLPSLAEHFDLELVVDANQPPVAPYLQARHLVLTAAEAVERHRVLPFDLFVYHVGNSHFHLYMLDLMRRFRGLVTLHDYYLGGLVRLATHAGIWPVTLAEELEAQAEPQMAAWLRDHVVKEWPAGEVVPLNARVLDFAQTVLVHSAWAWQRVRAQVDVPVALVPLHGLQVPRLRSRREERLALGLPADAYLVGTLGIVGYTKRVPSILRAVAALPADARAAARVVVVGEGSPDIVSAIRAEADRLGLGEQLILTGRVPLDRFWAYARAADVVVQLRYPSRGESSGAMLLALALGCTCVASDQGALAEFPADVVWRVRTPHREVGDLEQALRTFYRDPDRRLAYGRAAEEYVRRFHAAEVVAAQYAAVIREAVARRQAGDGYWLDCATSALADCADADAARRLIEPWLQLRRQALRQAAPLPEAGARPGESPAAPLRLAA